MQQTYSQNTTILKTSITLSTNYIFRQIIGHYHVVWNLSNNYTIYAVCSEGGGGDENSFTIVSGIDSKLIDM